MNRRTWYPSRSISATIFSASVLSGARIATKICLLTLLNAAISAARACSSGMSRSASVSIDFEVRSVYSTPYFAESISASCSSSRERSSCRRSSCFFSLNCVIVAILYRMRHAILLVMREAQPNRREFLATIAGGAVMAGLPKAAHAQEAPPETPMSPNPNGYDFSFDNYDNHEKTSDIPLVATYVDGMKSVLVQINSANSDEAAREKIRITVNELTMGYLQIHAEQNNIKEPNPAVDAEAMALALI